MESRHNAPRRSGSPAPPDPLGPVSTLLQRLAARVKFVGDMSQQMRTFRNDAALHPLLAVLHSPTDLTWEVTGQEHRARFLLDLGAGDLGAHVASRQRRRGPSPSDCPARR